MALRPCIPVGFPGNICAVPRPSGYHSGSIKLPFRYNLSQNPAAWLAGGFMPRRDKNFSHFIADFSRNQFFKLNLQPQKQ
jgi:hypothetical protein